MFWMGCWTGASNGSTVNSGDFDTNCKDANGAGQYSIWIQYHMESQVINKATTGAAATRLLFDQSTKAANGTVTYANDTAGKYTAGSWKHISDNQIMVAAEALASIWI
jgi:hypothetical protein